MGLWKNEGLLSKAAITSGSFAGGIGLSQEEADRFIDFVIDESTLKDSVRVERMNTATKKINKLFLADEKVLVPATAAVDPGETVAQTTSQIVLTGKEMIAVTRISDDALEDNVEGDDFADHLMQMVIRASMNQLETALIMGRLESDPNNLLDVNQLWDGWLALALGGGHVVDASGFSDRFIDQDKLSTLLKSIPTKFARNLEQLSYLMHTHVEQDYRNILAARGTGLGDQAVQGNIPMSYNSVPLRRVPLTPIDRPFAVAGGGDTDVAVNASKTDTSVELTTIAGLNVGENITFDPDGPREESFTILTLPGANIVTFAGGLRFDHDAGTVVKETLLDGTFSILTDRRNLIWGIQRDIRIETDRLPRLRATDWVVTMRMDANIENADASAVLTNLKSKTS